MNWLTNYIKPKLESLVKKRDVPKNLWIKCQCSTMIYYKDYEKSLGVCNECGTHMRLPAETRLKFLLDDNKYEKIKVPSTIVDPLSFKDKKRYKDRIKQVSDDLILRRSKPINKFRNTLENCMSLKYINI